MVIHPQVLFSGFASMGVPYAYAVAALMKRDYRNWIRPATPWLVCGAPILGTGIMMGGFWAYETLGWGGYWGWDPVENSSLVPWLVGVASLHTILAQRKTRRVHQDEPGPGIIVLHHGPLLDLPDAERRPGRYVRPFVRRPRDVGYWLLVGMIASSSGSG